MAFLVAILEKTLLGFAFPYRYSLQIHCHISYEDLICNGIPGQPIFGTGAGEKRHFHGDVVVVVLAIYRYRLFFCEKSKLINHDISQVK